MVLSEDPTPTPFLHQSFYVIIGCGFIKMGVVWPPSKSDGPTEVVGHIASYLVLSR